jgi:hypothetical protein
VTLEELRQLAHGVEPIALRDEALVEAREVAAFNESVAKFRELVVRARNGIVQGRQVQPGLAFEIRTLAEALPTERLRTGQRQRRG